ncbi:PilZ domain-containing protein [Methylobacterium organophilum]|uniref:PilZ domain-containing protein n=1 Tax=Methylobacterium organophilum TaxID=410 RepID=A0ABQ4T9M5_METOR|nr:PilZ domain-containing protein [Methylobacterium organophilum]GJE27761.1 hypothetical protein LKMONMHP_2622 [Methylobacterium organophilum]
MSAEQRAVARKKTFLKGLISFNYGSSSMDCLIRDISDRGARLELSETTTLPEVFDIHIPARDENYRATLCWRSNEAVGVAFRSAQNEKRVEPAAAAVDPSVTALLKRVAELEAENATLRTLLTKLGAPAQARSSA